MDDICIRPVCNDYDLWFATVECKLFPHQIDLVNPAGFSIGRAYLHPETNIPCIIWHNDVRIGYIIFRQWCNQHANGWSYFIDKSYQGKGYGLAAAKLAARILKFVDPSTPIKLSVEQANKQAQRLYTIHWFLSQR
jgi:ribosomal protein S18 acetylase RimI-like enzyme